MKITDVELRCLDVPFTPHTNEHMQYWLPHWRIVQVCRITLDNGVVGWGGNHSQLHLGRGARAIPGNGLSGAKPAICCGRTAWAPASRLRSSTQWEKP